MGTTPRQPYASNLADASMRYRYQSGLTTLLLPNTTLIRRALPAWQTCLFGDGPSHLPIRPPPSLSRDHGLGSIRTYPLGVRFRRNCAALPDGFTTCDKTYPCGHSRTQSATPVPPALQDCAAGHWARTLSPRSRQPVGLPTPRRGTRRCWRYG